MPISEPNVELVSIVTRWRQWLLDRVIRAMGDGGKAHLSPGDVAWVVSRYPHARQSERLAIILRFAGVSELLRDVDDHLSEAARVLDVGCGFGQIAHWIARVPSRTVRALDASRRRIDVAQASRTPPELSFQYGTAVSLGDLAPGPWDAYVFADLFNCMPAQSHAQVLSDARAAATEGALLFIRELATTPRWKLTFVRIEERLKWLSGYYGIRSTGVPAYRGIAAWRELLSRCGWELESIRRVGRFTPYPAWIGICRAVSDRATAVSD